MNPALPVLALLSLAGLLLRRREAGIAWVVCGLAGCALLWPALRLPDGIPSPAATLAQQAPWQGIADPAAGNGNLRDVTYQVEPWLLFLRHELRAGRLPFWDPHQFSGSPYWSNGSGAPLFPLHLLFAVLPLQLGLVLLPWLRLVIGGCGAWLLARELGLGRPSALLAALIFPLSGMITSFLLFPMGNCHALVPWVFLAVERLANGRGSWIGLALAGGLQLLGGHPETPVFTALLAGVYLLARGSDLPLPRPSSPRPSSPAPSHPPHREKRENNKTAPTGFPLPIVWAQFLAGWTVAGAIAAIHILPLYKTLTGSGKWLASAPGPAVPLGTIATVLLRSVLPEAFGNPAAGTWWGPFNYVATAIYAGALTLPFTAAGLVAVRGDRRWRAVAVMTLFALLAAYQLFGMRTVLYALPVIQRGLHHYMKFGLELGLALLAAAGCDRWLAGKGRGILAGSALVLALLGVTVWRFGGEWRQRGLLGTEIAWIAGIGGLALLLALSLRLRPSRRWTAWLLLPGLLVVDLVAAHGRTNPGLPAGKLYPVTGAVRFLQGRPERVAGLGTALFPDAAMVYGLYDVRGDSPVKLERYDRVYAQMGAGDPVYFRPIQNWRSPWLDLLGVRWVMAGPAEEAPAGLGWALAYAGTDARVYERPMPRPLVRLEEGAQGGEARVAGRAPGFWAIDLNAPKSGMLAVAETWDAGWSATLNGKPVAVKPQLGILLGVAVGPGPGHVELRYRPDGFGLGVVMSLLGLAAVGLGGIRRRRA
ncbi:MAG TPA: YfhO family protein [Thermoanaerobaculia bacterium]|nr:YfhO family protein [Thermoanaerobaculia bacterium]